MHTALSTPVDPNSLDRSAAEWFAEAQRCYVEEHQGCPWCGGPHRVARIESPEKTALACQRCDFQVVLDHRSQQCRFIPGEELSDMTETMLGYPIFHAPLVQRVS
jgi:hypothetical protein